MQTMNLWEATYKRCHGPHGKATSPEPPVWGTAQQIISKSNLIDSGGIFDKGDIPDADEEYVVNERSFAENQRGAFRDAIQAAGMEAIAFYAPIHFYGQEHWGIYFHSSNFLGACAEVAARLTSENWENIVADMLHAVGRHELFHAAVELFSTAVEDFGHLRYASPEPDNMPNCPCPYEAYTQGVYRKTLHTNDCLEEALATRLGFQCRFRSSGFAKVLAELIDLAPPAYSGWKAYRSAMELDRGILKLAAVIIEQTWPVAWAGACLKAASYAKAVWFPEITPAWLDSKGPVPRNIYRPNGARIKRFIQSIFGNCRLKDALRILERSYDAEILSGGKHCAVRFPNGNKVPFSASWRTVPPYWVGQIAGALGVSRTEIRSVLVG